MFSRNNLHILVARHAVVHVDELILVLAVLGSTAMISTAARLGIALLLLRALELRSSVLEPHFYLRKEEEKEKKPLLDMRAELN